MARLELEFSAKGIESSTIGINSISSALTVLEKKLEEAQKEVGRLTKEGYELEGALKNLRQELNAGSISEEKFAKESERLAKDIESVRHQLGYAQRNVTSLKATMDQLNDSSRSLGTSQKKLQGYANDFTGGIRSATSVSIEFTRILQDMPYGMQGISNNLQQLFTNWGYYTRSVREAAAAQGQVVTTGTLLKGALSSLISPANLLTLGVSLLTTGWVLYEKWQQKAKKATEEHAKAIREQKSALDEYLTTLDAQSRAVTESAASYAREITQLDRLYGSIRNTSSSRNTQIGAIKELQRLYPETFGHLKEDEFLTNKAADAYDRLRENITKTALAQAAMRLSEKSAEDFIKNTVAAQNAYQDASRELEKYNNLVEARDILQNRYNEYLGKTIEVEGQSIKVSKDNSYNIVRLNGLINQQRDVLAGSTNVLNGYKTAAETAKNEVKEFNEIANQNITVTTKQTGIIGELENKLRDLRDARPQLMSESDLKENARQIQDIESKLENLNLSLKKVTDTSEKEFVAVSRVAESISGVFESASIPIELVGLDKIQQSTVLSYQNLLNKVDKIEKEGLRKYKDNESAKKKITEQAAKERAEIIASREAELEQNRLSFAKKSEEKISELYARAGLSRIKSREQELASDKLFWDDVEQNAKEYGITSAQLTELRRSSEAQINEKWDSKANESQFVYQRKLNEGLTQGLIRRLNTETKLKVQAAQGDAEKLKAIQQDYWRKLEDLESNDRSTQVQLAFDGDALSVPLANVRSQMDELRRSFEQGTLSVAAFQQKISDLEMQRQQLQLFQGTVDNISESFGNLYADAIFNTEGAIDNLKKAFENTARSIISGLIKIAIRYAINQAIGTASMAAASAASAATATTVASAWSTAAAMVSAATFGANTVPAGAGLAALIASSKALAGFSRGGYTGNYGRRQIAGVVHGQEFVINARATQDNLPLLRAINAGVDVSSLMAHSAGIRDYGSISKNSNPRIEVWVDGEIQNGVIKLSNDAGNRKHKRFFR